MSRHTIWGIVLVLVGIMTAAGYWALLFPTPPSATQVEISASRVADYVRAVVEANRTVYEANVVDHLEAKGVARATAKWQAHGGLPLPDQFVLATGRVAEAHGVRYRLASLHPLNEHNAPQTEFERRGLDAVQLDPSTPYTGVVTLSGRPHFQAIYARVAIEQSCVVCHSELAGKSAAPYKVGDVLGGLIITLPLGD